MLGQGVLERICDPVKNASIRNLTRTSVVWGFYFAHGGVNCQLCNRPVILMASNVYVVVRPPPLRSLLTAHHQILFR